MKRIFTYLTANGVFLTVAYFGLFKGITWLENLLSFWVVSIFLLSVLITIVIGATKWVGALEPEHFKETRNKKLPFGDTGYLLGGFMIAGFLASGGAFWLSGMTLLTTFCTVFYVSLLRDE